MLQSGRLVLAVCLVLATWGAAPSQASADTASPWVPGPNAAGDDTYSGFIDGPVSGTTLVRNATVVVHGWVVDRTAVGWTGIDDVEVYLGLQDQGGPLLARADIAQPRPDVASALGNSYWGNAGFTATFSESGLTNGSNLVTIYAHTPDKGWWYKQIQLTLQALPAIAYADDPLLVVEQISPATGVDVPQIDHTTPGVTLSGYAIDRNLPLTETLGVDGSGVNTIQIYLDGPRAGGTFLGNAQLGITNRDALGFGTRFLQSGWQLTVHPDEFSIDKHEFYIYAASAYWPNETLVVIPFNVQ